MAHDFGPHIRRRDAEDRRDMLRDALAFFGLPEPADLNDTTPNTPHYRGTTTSGVLEEERLTLADVKEIEHLGKLTDRVLNELERIQLTRDARTEEFARKPASDVRKIARYGAATTLYEMFTCIGDRLSERASFGLYFPKSTPFFDAVRTSAKSYAFFPDKQALSRLATADDAPWGTPEEFDERIRRRFGELVSVRLETATLDGFSEGKTRHPTWYANGRRLDIRLIPISAENAQLGAQKETELPPFLVGNEQGYIGMAGILTIGKSQAYTNALASTVEGLVEHAANLALYGPVSTRA